MERGGAVYLAGVVVLGLLYYPLKVMPNPIAFVLGAVCYLVLRRVAAERIGR